MKIREILESKGGVIQTVAPDQTVFDAAHKISTAEVGALLVTDQNDALVGIVTERDIVRGVDRFRSELPDRTIGDLMTRAVITCSPEDDLTTVADKMNRNHIRHLPVTEEDAVVGILSIRDVVRYQSSALRGRFERG